jgi:cytochrome P450 family 103
VSSEVRRPVTIAASDLEARPHEIFSFHRPRAPIVMRDDGVYVALRAADIESLASNVRTRQLETEYVRSRGISDGPLFDVFDNTMLMSNGQDHRRRRAPVARAFAYKLIMGMRPRIREIANELIDRVYARRAMNLRDDFAARLPAMVICDILGIPSTDVPLFTRNVYALARAFSSSFAREDVPAIEAAARDLTSYAYGLLETRRIKPANDFLSSYVAALDESEKLSAVETVIQIITLILGGSDTTRAAMVIQTALLLKHRNQWDAVCREYSLVPGAVAESLRYEPSVGSFMRVTLQDIDLDGWVVPANKMLSLSTLSAMRDPTLYDNPDTFDIRRTDHRRKHMVFGMGAHRCLGEVLAAVELEEGLAALSARLPGMFFDGAPPLIHGSGGIRTVDELWVCWK